MLKVLLVIIISPVVLICGIITMTIMIALLEMLKDLILKTAKSVSNSINKRDDS